MKTGKITTAQKIINTMVVTVAGGEAAKLIHYHLLTDEAKFALNNAGKSQDVFVSETKKCAQETIKSLGQKVRISVDEICQKAKEIYPELSANGQKVLKSVAKTGLIAGAGCAAAALLYNFVIAPNKNK